MKKIIFVVFLNKNGIHSIQWQEVPEICFSLIIGWDVSGKAILNEHYYLQCQQFQFVVAHCLVRLDKQFFG